jgi:hypothetical protein
MIFALLGRPEVAAFLHESEKYQIIPISGEFLRLRQISTAKILFTR